MATEEFQNNRSDLTSPANQIPAISQLGREFEDLINCLEEHKIGDRTEALT